MNRLRRQCDEKISRGVVRDLKTCLKSKNLKIKEENVGRVSFTLIKGHERVHQEVSLPRLKSISHHGREFFAKWTPVFD